MTALRLGIDSVSDEHHERLELTGALNLVLRLVRLNDLDVTRDLERRRIAT